MANDAHEEFWGCTITKDRKDFLWDPLTESEEDVEHKLQLTSACLGHKAKDGERNLLEVTTEDEDGKKITCSLVSLRVGGQECVHLDNGFFNTTKFTLKEGSGPLSLCGVHLRALPLDFDENEDSSEDEEVPDLVPAEPAKKEKKEIAKPAETKQTEKKVVEKKTEKKVEEKKPASPAKRPLAAEKKNEKPAKKPKIVEMPEEDSEEDDSDFDEEEDDEESGEEEESMLDDKAIEDSDEDSEEGDDEPEEGDDLESDEDEDMDSEDDDDEDDESDEDSEEEEEKPAKKPKVNGNVTKSTPGKGGPQKNKTAEVKTPNTKKTPAKKDNNTTTPKSQAKKTPEELKAFLLKSPNLPKKFDKFANFMKNNMKVVDEKSQKEFWDYVQKNKK